MKVVYTDSVMLYIMELTDILYDRGYFNIKDSAKEYVYKMIKQLEATIHIKNKRKASPHFNRYGTGLYYVSIPKNKRTTWYFFFNYYPAQDIYYIRYITNNHVAGHLI